MKFKKLKTTNKRMLKALIENLFLVLIIFFMTACSDSSILSNESPTVGNQHKSADKAKVDDIYNSNSGKSDLKKESKIIKQGNLDFDVTDLKKVKEK